MMEQATINIITQHNLAQTNQNFRLIHTIQKTVKTINSMYVYRDTLYLGTRNSKLYIYKLNGFKLQNQRFINPHCEVVSGVIADDKFIITFPEMDQESQVAVWDTETRMFINAFQGHKSQISKAIFLNKQDEYLSTCSWDGTVRIWNLKNFQKDSHQKIYKGTYPMLCLSQLNKEILTFGGDDCYLTFWNWQRQQVITKMFAHAGSLTNIQPFMPYLMTCGGDHKFKFWLVDHQMAHKEGQSSTESVYNIKVIKQQKQAYDSNIYSVCLSDKVIYLIDREGQTYGATLNSIKKIGNQFEYYENASGLCLGGDYLIVSTTKGTIKFYRTSERYQIENEINLKMSL